MKRSFVIVLVGAAAGLLVLAAGAFAVWNWLLGPTLEASGQITAIPVVVSVSTSTPASAPAATATSAPAAGGTEPAAPTAAPTEAASTAASGVTVLEIVQAESEVRFILTEELRGRPTTVVGISNQVAGQIVVDPADLSTAQVGVIQVNARTLETDNSQRNRAIRNQILSTDAHEFITFTPSDIVGLSGSAAPGDSFSFQIAGTLTIRGVSQPVVFDVNATVEALDRLVGSAVTTVQRSDFGLVIPSVPSVANVSESVTVEIDFTATGVHNGGNG